MEAKKNPQADLTKKSGLFFSAGLLISMLLVVTAFEWQQEEEFIDTTGKNQDIFPEWTDVPPTEICHQNLFPS